MKDESFSAQVRFFIADVFIFFSIKMVIDGIYDGLIKQRSQGSLDGILPFIGIFVNLFNFVFNYIVVAGINHPRTHRIRVTSGVLLGIEVVILILSIIKVNFWK